MQHSKPRADAPFRRGNHGEIYGGGRVDELDAGGGVDKLDTPGFDQFGVQTMDATGLYDDLHRDRLQFCSHNRTE
jgi:hypothetical protein